MPAVSEAQRRYLNAQFGHDWVKEHHFDNKGKLPKKIKKGKGKKRKGLSVNVAVQKQKRSQPRRSGRGAGKTDPTQTITLRRLFATQLNKQFGLLKGDIVKLLVDEDAFGLIEREPYTFNYDPRQVRDTLGRFTAGAASVHSQALEAVRGMKDKVGGSLKRYIDKVPGGNAVRTKLSGLKGNMEERYGKKTAGRIFATANAISWGAFLIGPLVGQPNYIPASGLMVVGAVLAEGYLQSRKAVKALTGNELTDNREDLTTVEIEELARQVLDQLYNAYFVADNDPLTNTRWKFNSSPEKVRAFQYWLKAQISSRIKGMTEEALWKKYIEQGFKKGAGRSFDDVRQSRLQEKHPELFTEAGQSRVKDFYQGTREEFLRSSFAQPIAMEKVELLVSRSFEELKNVTDDMANKMTRTLADGLVQGKGPREVAKDLTAQVGLGSKRALVIARTELIRAHAEGQLVALENMGIEDIGIAVEWSTSGLGRTKKGNPSPCKKCAHMKGVVLKLSEAKGKIPFHPNCMCAWIPANVGEGKVEQRKQKTTKQEITQAFKEAGETDFEIAFKRPESIIGNIFCPTGEGGGVDPSCSPGEKGGSSSEATGSEKHLKIAQEMGFSAKDIFKLAGGIEGAKVTIVDGVRSSFGPEMNRIKVEVSHKDYKAKREIYGDHLENDTIEVHTKGQGLGTKIFASQVDAATKFPQIDRIEAFCAKGDGTTANGYYTWPRLGYDARLGQAVGYDKNKLKELSEKFGIPDNGKVSDLMKTSDGRVWWKENGLGFSGTFDLTNGSLSREVLSRYMQEKGLTANYRNYVPEVDDELLDRIWDNLTKTVVNTHFPFRIVQNINPQGCNQFTGPGCSVSSLEDRVKSAYDRLYGPKEQRPKGKEKKALEAQYKQDLDELRSQPKGKKVAETSKGEGTAKGNAAISSSEKVLEAFRNDPGYSHNLVHLADLRKALGHSKEDFEAVLLKARQEGKIVLKLGEGREGLSDKDKEGAIHEADPIKRFNKTYTHAALKLTQNVFCKTGEGGGIDPTCSPGDYQQKQSNWLDSFEDPKHEAEYNAIRSLSHEKFTSIRDHLRGNTKGSEWAEDAVDKIRTAMDRAPKYQGKVYRGISLDRAEETEKMIQQMEKTGEFSDPGFMSTSKGLGIGQKFGGRDERGILFHIQPKQSAVDISALSKHKHEEEVLIRDGTKFKVTKIVKPKYSDDRYEVHLEEQNLTDNVFCPTGEGGGIDATCSTGGKGPDTSKSKFIGKAVGTKEHQEADRTSAYIAEKLGGVVEEATGGKGQKDKKPYDVRVKKQGIEGAHDIEVKSFLKGEKDSLSVHEDALLRKVEHIKENPKNTFHTIAVDKRNEYEGGAYKELYSGHTLYYKRGSGRYTFKEMYKAKDTKELKQLLKMKDNELPEQARGKLPPPPPLKKLRETAEKASQSRKRRDKARKEKNKDKLKEQARQRRLKAIAEKGKE